MAPEAGLSRATFAKLSPHPYLLANLEPSDDDAVAPARSNGRTPDEVRPTTVNLSSLSHPHGSSLVRMGDTTVICGVRGETILTRHIPSYRASNKETELSDYDLLVPNIELATGSSPQFLPGGPPTTLAQTLSTRIYSLLHDSKLVQPEDLRIWHERPSEHMVADEDKMEEDEGDADEQTGEKYVAAYWVLYIDIFFISFDGNPFDAAWAATLAALRDTKLPKARYDPDRELILCTRKDPRPLTITTMPVACTAAVFTGKETDRHSDGRFWLLVDPDRLEESLCDESITIVVDCQEEKMKILSISKHGGVVLTPKLLRSKGLMNWANQRWKGVAAAITGN